jgi:hypothetical protein
MEETMRKLSLTLLIALLLSLFVASPALADKSYYAERFDVQIDLQENGSAIITETVEFRFSGDPFTFAFREISAAETDGLTFLDASMDGIAMPLGTAAGQAEVKAGNPLKVTWHFSPTSDTAHVFTIRYRAEGVIRKGNADALARHPRRPRLLDCQIHDHIDLPATSDSPRSANSQPKF